MKVMRKKDLAESLREEFGFTIQVSQDVVNNILRTIESSLIKGDEVNLTGIGTFVVKVQKARTMRNPQTGENMNVPEKNTLRFRKSNLIIRKIN